MAIIPRASIITALTDIWRKTSFQVGDFSFSLSSISESIDESSTLTRICSQAVRSTGSDVRALYATMPRKLAYSLSPSPSTEAIRKSLFDISHLVTGDKTWYDISLDLSRWNRSLTPMNTHILSFSLSFSPLIIDQHQFQCFVFEDEIVNDQSVHLSCSDKRNKWNETHR